jgi:hypothetical protein
MKKFISGLLLAGLLVVSAQAITYNMRDYNATVGVGTVTVVTVQHSTTEASSYIWLKNMSDTNEVYVNLDGRLTAGQMTTEAMIVGCSQEVGRLFQTSRGVKMLAKTGTAEVRIQIIY